MNELFLRLYNCENSNEVQELICTTPSLSDDKNWLPYGGNTNNFGTFENQQSSPIAALIEKVTNSIDAILIKECKALGIDPEGCNAPKNMEDAIKTFFNVKNGNWEEALSTDRRKVAENIQIIATGSKESPNLTIYDCGEGQHPNDFQKTFLSLHRGNKVKIPFVQGKFNMGSTGAVVFCGGDRYQLIVSRRSDMLNNHDSNEIGFTLVRRHKLKYEEEDQARSTWYEYYAPNGQIPRFFADELDLGLFNRKFTSGSLVKLFSYDLPPGSRSYVTLDLWKDLNQYLYNPALPILLYEKRYMGAHSDSKLMLGNKARIMLFDKEKKERTLSLCLHS